MNTYHSQKIRFCSLKKILSLSLLFCLHANADSLFIIDINGKNLIPKTSTTFNVGDSVYTVSVDSNIETEKNQDALICKADFLVKDEKNTIFKDEISRKVSFTLKNDGKTLDIINETGTLTRGIYPWSIFTHFVEKKIKYKDCFEITVWAILANGEFGSGKTFQDPQLYNYSKNINKIKRREGSAILIKIGTVPVKIKPIEPVISK